MREQPEIFNGDTSPLKRVNGKLNLGQENNVEARKTKKDKLLANGNGVNPVSIKKGIRTREKLNIHSFSFSFSFVNLCCMKYI